MNQLIDHVVGKRSISFSLYVLFKTGKMVLVFFGGWERKMILLFIFSSFLFLSILFFNFF